MKRNGMMAFVAILGILHSCEEPILTEGHDVSEGSLQEISFMFSGQVGTKGSVSPDESKVNSVAVYAYEEGLLVDKALGNGKEELVLNLIVGHTYRLYALANMKEYPEIPSEDEFIVYPYRIGELEDLNSALPMAWHAEFKVIRGISRHQVSLERLTSKIEFEIDKGLLEDMDVVSVRLCQSPISVRPFQQGGSRALNIDEVMDGDYASQKDIAALNDGQSISLYLLENCQGRLLDSNTDPWQKVPDNMDEDLAGCCTYIEAKCRFPETDKYGVYCGEVIYRFYLGEDATSDFSVIRNTVRNVSLITTQEGLGRISWRVDASGLVFRGGDVSGAFVDNFHASDNFYVSEYVYFEFDMDPAAEDYWRRHPYVLAGLGEDGETLMTFSDMIAYGDGSYSCVGKALKPGNFDVWLIDHSGRPVDDVFEGGVIRTPRVVIGNGERYSGNNKVETVDQDIEIFINEGKADVFIYLVDDEGYNINQSYGCDCMMMEWTLDVSAADDGSSGINSLVDIVGTKVGDTASEAFVYRFGLSVTNDGDDDVRNRSLSNIIGRGRNRIVVNEDVYGLQSSHTASVYADDIEVVLTTSSPYSYRLGTSMAYSVVNPSKLPFIISGWKVDCAKDAGVASYYNEAVSNINGFLEVYPMFVSDMSSWTEESPMYISMMPQTVCSFEDDADTYIRYEEAYLYPAYDQGVTNLYLKYAVEADRRQLQAGGYQYRTVKDKHHVLQAKMQYPCTDPPIFRISSDINYGDIRQLPSLFDEGHDPIHVEMYYNDNYQLVAVSSEPVTLDIEESGTLSSHIRTVSGHDLLIGSIDIKYYKHTHEFSSSRNDVRLSQTPTVVDDSSVQNLLQYIRTIEYYSKYDGINAREVLKPYAMTLSVDIVPKSGRPVYVTFPNTLVYRYENINYTYGEPPSTFNHKAKDIPNAEAFVDDIVYLELNVSSSVLPEMNLVRVIE